jgi:hypothetical protein
MVRTSSWTSTPLTAPHSDGIAVGVQSLVKRLREAGWLKSVDERRGKLKVRRVIDGSRLEVLHLHANVLEHFVAEKWPIRPFDGREE